METRLGGRHRPEGHTDDDEERFALIDHSGGQPLRTDSGRGRRGAPGKRRLSTALAALDPRSRRILEARWLHDGEAATLHDPADEFQVSAERIRQIEVKALQKMEGATAQPAAA